jgi:hypothetical protein
MYLIEFLNFYNSKCLIEIILDFYFESIFDFDVF